MYTIPSQLPEVKTRWDIFQSKAAVLLVVNGGRGVEKVNGPAVTSSREWSDYDKYSEQGIYKRKQESKKGRKREFMVEFLFSWSLSQSSSYFLLSCFLL